jgi:hypothetical protein
MRGTPKAADAFPTDDTSVDRPRAKKRGDGYSNDDDPTSIYDSGTYPSTPKATLPKPGEPDFVREAATPIRVRSMKPPGQASSGEIPLPADVPRPQHQVKLRAISEVASKRQAPQLALGFLAPPRDPNAVRARRWRDFVVWGSVCVILACVVALGIWFIAK